MDPNLLPKNSREMETSEQAKLKRIRASLDVVLNSPKPELEAKPAKKKNGGFWKNLFGAPVSPIKDVALTSPEISHNNSKSLDLLSSGKSIKNIASRPAEIKPIPKPEAKQPAYHPVYKPAPPAPAVSSQKPEPQRNERPHRDSKATTPFNLVPKHEKSAEVNVNLMPQELALRRESASVASGIKSLIIAVLAPALILTIGFGVILFLQNDLKTRMSAKQAEFNNLNSQIGDFLVKEKANNVVADRVAIISKLLAEKITWNNFFDKLEKYTLDGVYYNNLTADTSGVLTLPGVADNYETLAKQLAVFKAAGDFIKDVKLTSAQLSSEGKAGVVGVGFQLRLTLQDKLFIKPIAAK